MSEEFSNATVRLCTLIFAGTQGKIETSLFTSLYVIYIAISSTTNYLYEYISYFTKTLL